MRTLALGPPLSRKCSAAPGPNLCGSRGAVLGVDGRACGARPVEMVREKREWSAVWSAGDKRKRYEERWATKRYEERWVTKRHEGREVTRRYEEREVVLSAVRGAAIERKRHEGRWRRREAL